MKENYTISLIADTGYKSWMDFYFQQDSYTARKDFYEYSYKRQNKESAKIPLPFPKEILEILALEESKLMLTYIQAKSFTELLEFCKDRFKRSFVFDVVIIEDRTISYKKVRISMDEMVSLSVLEKITFPYLVHDNTKQNRVLKGSPL
jgi:hypothetical protein